MSKARDKAIDESIAGEREQRDFQKYVKAAQENAELRGRVQVLTKDLDVAEKRLEVFTKLEDAASARKPYVPPPLKAGKRRGAFVLQASDWHVGEKVDPATVSGRNEYTPDIAIKRVDKLIEGARWMIESWRSTEGYGWSLDEAVVGLQGDLITGHIHDDLKENNTLSPTQEVLLAQELCIKLIEAVAAHPGVKRVRVPTSWGNHGRTTPERRVSTAWKTSYEWMMYQLIAKYFAGHPKVEIITGTDEITRLKILNTTTRWTHGDQVNYNGGVGGLTIPLLKWLAKLDETEPADVTFIGHHHHFLDVGRGLVNNCLIGWNVYAQRMAGFAPASQVACLIDERWGKKMSTEIVVQ